MVSHEFRANSPLGSGLRSQKRRKCRVISASSFHQIEAPTAEGGEMPFSVERQPILTPKAIHPPELS